MTFRVKRMTVPALLELDGLDERAFVSVEKVSRVYEPYRVRRIHRAMRIFGGLGAELGTQPDDDEDDEEEIPDEPDEVIERLKDKTTVLHQISFSAAGGTCVAIVGPPRSGKSTLMKIVAGVIPPSSGRVVVHGLVGPILDSALALFPRYGTFEKVLPTVGAFLHIPPRHVRHHLDGIFEFLGSQELRQKTTSSVSGKTHRDVLFATMLAVDPDVVLVDALIPKAMSEDISRRLLEIKASGGLVLITGKDPHTVSWIADRVITLENGAVVADQSIGDALERFPAPLQAGGEGSSVTVG